MDVIHYKCACGATMHAKARWGSRQFESGFAVSAWQSVMLGRIVDDPARPASTIDNVIGRTAKEGSEDHNATLVTCLGKFDPSPQYRRPIHVRSENQKDLEMRISLPEDETSKEAALDRLDSVIRALTVPAEGQEKNEVGLTASDVAHLRCYMTGGHEWVPTHQVSVDGTVTEFEKEEA